MLITEARDEIAAFCSAHPYDVPASAPAAYACKGERQTFLRVMDRNNAAAAPSKVARAVSGVPRQGPRRQRAHRLPRVSHAVHLRRMRRVVLRPFRLWCGSSPRFVVIVVIALKTLPTLRRIHTDDRHV